MLSLIGCMVWLPEQTKNIGMGRFAQFAGLAGCLMCFFSTFSIGGVLNTASAGISGCFVACLNVWLLRGFFPNGVEPGMTATSPASITGWIDLVMCNLMGGHVLHESFFSELLRLVLNRSIDMIQVYIYMYFSIKKLDPQCIYIYICIYM